MFLVDDLHELLDKEIKRCAEQELTDIYVGRQNASFNLKLNLFQFHPSNDKSKSQDSPGFIKEKHPLHLIVRI